MITGNGDGRVLARRRNGVAPWLAAALGLALMLMAPATPARAQLGAGQLQKVHALTVNTAAWAVLRKLVGLVARDAGLETIANSPDAVDTISVILALSDAERRLDPVLAGAVRAGLTAHPVTAAPSATFSSLGLSRGRALGVACMIFGQSPDNRQKFAALVGLDERNKALCPRDFQAIASYWQPRMSGLLRGPNNDLGFGVKVQLDPAGGSAATARLLLESGQTLQQVAAISTARLALRRDLTIRGADCGEKQVMTPGNSGQIVICYNLMADIANAVAVRLTGQ